MDFFDQIDRTNADYVEQMYQKYLTDPMSVGETWRIYFAGFDMGFGRAPKKGAGHPPAPPGDASTKAAPAVSNSDDHQRLLSIEVADLVHSYRELGHFVATLDPLGHNRPSHPLLSL